MKRKFDVRLSSSYMWDSVLHYCRYEALSAAWYVRYVGYWCVTSRIRRLMLEPSLPLLGGVR